MPEIAGEISGKIYRLEKNDFGITALSLSFKDTKEGILTLDTPDGKRDVPIGLDELYRFSDGMGDVPVGFRGRWIRFSPYFELDWVDLGESFKIQGLFIFEGDEVRILVTIKPLNRFQTVVGKAVVN